MNPQQQIDADLQQHLFDLRSTLADLSDACERLTAEIIERGASARLPQTAIGSALGGQMDRHLAAIDALRQLRRRLGGAR